MKSVNSPIRWRRWLPVVGVATIAGVIGGSVVWAAQAPGASVKSGGGLHVVSFNSLRGTVRVNLPDDIRPGETVSGTIAIEPAGSTEAERAANGAMLRATVVDFGGAKSSAGEPALRRQVPAAAGESLPVVFSPPRQISSRAVTALIPVRTAVMAAVSPAPSPGFQPPPVATAGSPTVIRGQFDGDATNTQVALNSALLPVLAETPRQAVIELPPPTPPGAAALSVRDGGVMVRRPLRVVQVRLTAPKTDLLRGETTPLNVAVAGLQGLQHPVPFQLRTMGTVTTEGGNFQAFDILPHDPGVLANGEFRINRTVTGTAAGGFDITAEVGWAKPAPHWLAGRTVHVEGSPGGQRGRWRVPVKMPPDDRPFGVYFGGDKAPPLQFCNWIEIGAAEEIDGVNFVTDYTRTADSTKPVPAANPPPPRPPPPVPLGGGTPVKEEPPPCKEGEERELSAVPATFLLLDGKQERTLQVSVNNGPAIDAAAGLADYLKKIAELGGKAEDILPDGDGPGGAVVGFLIKYLEMGSTTIEETLKGKIPLRGVRVFSASMTVGIRKIDATCATEEKCVRGVRVTEKRYSESESVSRETFTWEAKMGDDAWERITRSGLTIDPKEAAAWANEQFVAKAKELQENAENRKKFADACK